ncbi:ubiquitin-like-specific protease 1D [Telopea speciosissima]|uniref:ubiquitin-like-specific protease 1D n=1 Tax=Telopea speciosissima TaxID=54955 RepID=UPI001CC43BAE|nr:ubiquitin-like-specific protease 1D [Telopea speciosissima]
MDGGKEGKKPLVIDWNVILDNDDDPAELDVVRDEQSSQSEDLQIISDHNLDGTICRLAKNVNILSPKLSDKGAKLRIRIQRLEHEKNRRSLLQLQADEDCRNVTHSGACSGSNSVFQSSQVTAKSEFTSCFIEILETKSDASTRVGGDAFAKEFSYLHSGDRQDARQNGRLIHEENQSRLVSSRDSPFKFMNIGCHDKDRQRCSNGGDQKGIAPSSLDHQEENLSGHFFKKKYDFADTDDREVCCNKYGTLLYSPSSHLPSKKKLCYFVDIAIWVALMAFWRFLGFGKKGQSHQTMKQGQSHQTVVLVDEEDCPSVETTLQAGQPIGQKKDTKIYYPSRNDPESVELCYSDIACLAPEAFLSSIIMNFYIRYLRRLVSPTGRPRGDYHFFNTYFYEKLKEAVSDKRSQKDAFVKFRRWWKGVNIFQKAYILLPIHEKKHWSLLIICNPEKDEESGHIILLHLDSLGCHTSSEIFENIRRFLKEEWKYVSEEVAPLDPSIGDGEWRNLQDKITERRIMVPQQKNDYDCGIFVLYFMERFIEEAPERIKKKNIPMFGERWFEPEEASGLRERIRELLNEEFENAKMEDLSSRESSPVSQVMMLE